MKRIDFENHLYAPDFFYAVAKASRDHYPWYDEKEDYIHWSKYIKMTLSRCKESLLLPMEERLAWLDRAHIDTAVLCCSAGVEQLEGETAKEVAYKTNNYIYEHTKRFPNRFLGSAILPTGDIDASCRELERCVKELGFVAWHVHSNFGDSAPDDPRYLPIFEKAQELGVYVYLHPQMPEHPRMRDLEYGFAGAVLGFTQDTQITLLRMICTGLFDKVPELKMMVGHLGEGLPFLLERIDNRLKDNPTECITMKKGVKEYFRNNILVSTSGNASKEAFECTKQVIGIDRMFIGSDMPYEKPEEMTVFLDSVSLTTEEREKLYFRNAEKLLGIK